MITSAGQVGGGSGADPAATRQARIRAQAARLEGVFMQELLKAMRETVPKEGVLEGGQGEDIFSSMFDEHIADVAARRNGGALADALVRQLAGPDAADTGGAGTPAQSGDPAGAAAVQPPEQAWSIAAGPDQLPVFVPGKVSEP